MKRIKIKSDLIGFKNNKGWVLVFVALGVVIAAQLVVSNLAAGKGQHLTELERKAGQLSRENQSLAEGFAQESSLTKLAADAASSGFEKPENILYLDTANPVAQASQ